jgi:hypothetical protein
MARAIWRGSVLAESADIVVVDGYTYSSSWCDTVYAARATH